MSHRHPKIDVESSKNEEPHETPDSFIQESKNGCARRMWIVRNGLYFRNRDGSVDGEQLFETMFTDGDPSVGRIQFRYRRLCSRRARNFVGVDRFGSELALSVT